MLTQSQQVSDSNLEINRTRQGKDSKKSAKSDKWLEKVVGKISQIL